MSFCNIISRLSTSMAQFAKVRVPNRLVVFDGKFIIIYLLDGTFVDIKAYNPSYKYMPYKGAYIAHYDGAITTITGLLGHAASANYSSLCRLCKLRKELRASGMDVITFERRLKPNTLYIQSSVNNKTARIVFVTKEFIIDIYNNRLYRNSRPTIFTASLDSHSFVRSPTPRRSLYEKRLQLIARRTHH